MTADISRMCNGAQVKIDINEIRQPELDSSWVAAQVATQLERRVSFRRAMKRAIQTAMDFGADGIRIRCAGRLGGADIARSEAYREGKVPLQTLRVPIDYGFAEAETTWGYHRSQGLDHEEGRSPGRKSEASRREGPPRGQGGPRPPRREPAVPESTHARVNHFPGEKPCPDPKTSEVSQDPPRQPRGNATRGTKVSFGEFGLQCLGRGWITNRQIEACRISVNRYLKRKGKVWIRIFPHKPVTARPPETGWVRGKAPSTPGWPWSVPAP